MRNHIVNDRLKGHFYKVPVSQFLRLEEVSLDFDNTFFIGYNPGFGSGYDLLLNSWSVDLVALINQNCPVIFTQANDYSDLRGEKRVLEVILEGKAKYINEPEANPFRAATHYHEEGKKEQSWSCSSTHFYAI